jgi:hypothetical protein
MDALYVSLFLNNMAGQGKPYAAAPVDSADINCGKTL